MLKMLSHLIEDLKQSTAKYKRVSLDKSQYKSEGQKHKKTMYFIMCKLISKTYLQYKMLEKKKQRRNK